MRFLLSFSVLLLLLHSPECYSQSYKYRYYLDENLNSVPEAKASITGKAYWDSGGFKMDCFAKTTGQLLLTAYFADSTLSFLKGRFISYFSNGQKESEGDYVLNYMNGLWQSWNENGTKKDSCFYKDGVKIKYATFGYYDDKNKTRLTEYMFKDSLADKLYETYFADEGYKTSEVEFTGDKGLLKIYDSTGLKSQDSVFSREEKEAVFADGGDAGWRQFLQKNLDVDVPVRKRAPAGMYTVIVRFIVEKDGALSNFKAETNIGYGTETEALRVLKRSPKWSAAKQYGRFVRAYRRQPITFAVSNE